MDVIDPMWTLIIAGGMLTDFTLFVVLLTRLIGLWGLRQRW
jgi:hypothetical protein